MNIEKIEQLIRKYYEGETSLEEEKLLRKYFQNEKVADHLKSYGEQFQYTSELRTSEPGNTFDPFEKIDSVKDDLPNETGNRYASSDNRQTTGSLFTSLDNKVKWTLRIAAGFILLLVGFSAGLLINQQPPAGEQVAALQHEVEQMKKALVYGYDRRLSASERISAVRLSEQLPDQTETLDSEITDILIYTLNNDENVNVREAAAEALFRFRNDPHIRKALVHSLSRQNDPLMQITLINMLVELKETSAINEMQKLLMDSETRDLVKSRLEVGIAELKT